MFICAFISTYPYIYIWIYVFAYFNIYVHMYIHTNHTNKHSNKSICVIGITFTQKTHKNQKITRPKLELFHRQEYKHSSAVAST